MIEDKPFIDKKIDFLTSHLESLAKYESMSIQQLKKKPIELKYVEKLIQELVDCAVDINQIMLENITANKAWSYKQSFRDLESKVLNKHKLEFGDKDLQLFIDSVSFRNEIVHSYDVNVYIIWSKRNISTIINLYKNYCEKIIDFMECIQQDDTDDD